MDKAAPSALAGMSVAIVAHFINKRKRSSRVPPPVVIGTAAALVVYLIRKRRARASNEVPDNTVHPEWPLLGHLPTLLKYNKLSENGFAMMANECATSGIGRMRLLSTEAYLLKDPEMVREVFTDHEHWGKESLHKSPIFRIVRAAAGNGLFTADDSDEQWGIAHRILTKPFSRDGMMAFVPMMNTQADNLCALIDREVADGGELLLNDLVTKMAFETIAYCGMGETFGSFDSQEVHPFVTDLGSILSLTDKLGKTLIKPLAWRKHKEYQDVIKRCNVVIDEIVRKRKNKETRSPGQMPDLLDLMLQGVDSKTGQKLSDENIRFQIITFLVAGHDTTASAMGYFFDFVLRDPRIESKLMREIQEVVGDGDVKWEHLNKMKYLNMCQKETLRLQPPARAVLKSCLKDTMLANKYKVKAGELAFVPFTSLHQDKKLWGDDADKFVPERWEKGQPHPFAYIPFSMGPRGCIGMEFSIVEQKIAIVKLLQRYSFRFPPGDRKLQLENRLFVGPTNFKLQAFRRQEFGAQALARQSSKQLVAEPRLSWAISESSAKHGSKLNLLYGSNGGSTKDLAQQVAVKARALGFETKLAPMNDFARREAIEAGSSTIVLAATYNGMPADNAVAFMKFLEDMKATQETPFEGTQFAVFGCGNMQWAATYQHCPIAIDEAMEALGSARLLVRHAGDSAEDLDAAFEDWLDVLWPALAREHGVSVERVEAGNEALAMPLVQVLASGTQTAPLSMPYETATQQMAMVDNRELVKEAGSRSVRHIEFDLPSGVKYQTGDHLVIYPENDAFLVKELLAQLKLKEDLVVRIDLSPVTGAPEVHRVLLKEWLLRAVDLSKGLSAKSLQFLASKAGSEVDAIALQALSEKDIAQRMQFSLVELLQRFPSVAISLSEALALLSLMKPRLYSISSSPLASSGKCSITVGVLKVQTASGREHRGVCSNYLAGLAAGAKVWAAVRDTGSSFRPVAGTPMILVGPGTGLAPLRGFLQEVQQQRKQGKQTGPVHLYFGCRTDAEFLYEDELRAFKQDGTLAELHVAFSRQGQKQYVQQVLKQQASTVWNMLDGHAHVFVCGDASSMAPAVRETIQGIASVEGKLGDGAQKWMEELRCNRSCRYHEDVWAGNA